MNIKAIIDALNGDHKSYLERLMSLNDYKARSGHFIAVWTLEIQTPVEDVDKILDAIMAIYPLAYGRYQRNASVSAMGVETSQPQANSTTTTHLTDYKQGNVETYPMTELKVCLERDQALLEKVMDAIHYVHHYEEPVIFLREDWVSRAAYNPNNDNPHRWWNNGRGITDKVTDIVAHIKA